MKAVVFRDPKLVQGVEVDDPRILEPRDAIVRVSSVGSCCPTVSHRALRPSVRGLPDQPRTRMFRSLPRKRAGERPEGP